jgi:hypothetical protein
MEAYITVGLLLLFLALIEVLKPHISGVTGFIALILVTSLAALRHETGYDWFEYETFFDQSVSFSKALESGIPTPDLPMEPLYVALNMSIKSFDGPFSLLVAISAIFSCGVVHLVTRQISSQQSTMWMVYFALAFLIVQMATIRQAIATAFLLVAFLCSVNKRTPLAWTSLVVAVGFHASAAMFAPFLILAAYRPSLNMIAAYLIPGILFVILGFHPINAVLDAMMPFVPEFISEKFRWYYVDDAVTLSVAAIALTGFHLVCLGALVLCSESDEKNDRFLNIAIWLTLLVLGMHLYFSGAQVLWNRVMCVTLPWQICAVFRLRRVQSLWLPAKLTLVGLLGGLCIGALAYTLAKPESMRYIPYNSIVQVWLYDEPGDGRQRAREWLETFDGPILRR